VPRQNIIAPALLARIGRGRAAAAAQFRTHADGHGGRLVGRRRSAVDDRGSRGERVSDFRRNRRDRTTEALDEYLRALGQAARDQVVAEAEEEVCRAWGDELARVQSMTEAALASADAACQIALTLVREHQRDGDLSALLRAQGRLEKARDQRRRSDGAAQVLLAAIDEELDLLALAAEERETVALANRIWVSSAGRAVYAAGAEQATDSGTDSGPGTGPGTGTDRGGRRPTTGWR
jgi:hypothetical protein